MVRMLNSINLHMAFGLAKMQEENVAALRRTTRLGSLPNGHVLVPNGLVHQFEKRVLLPIQRLSLVQMRERREKGLCYNCDDK